MTYINIKEADFANLAQMSYGIDSGHRKCGGVVTECLILCLYRPFEVGFHHPQAHHQPTHTLLLSHVVFIIGGSEINLGLIMIIQNDILIK